MPNLVGREPNQVPTNGMLGTAAFMDAPNLPVSTPQQAALDAKQPIDADLTAIAALTGTTGLLKKTAANTWELDTTSYSTLPLANLAQSGANVGDSIVWDGTSWVAGQPLPGSWTDAYAFLMDAGNTGPDLETYLGVSENYFGFTALLARYEWLTVCDTASAAAMFAASSTAMTAVAASSTAFAAILVSSTAFAAVVASSTAMAAVANSATALAAVFANSSAKAAFKASTALTVAAIPTMTSNTAPSGTAAASTTYGVNTAWKALDKNTSSNWLTSMGAAANQWLSYDFTAPRFIHTAKISTQYWVSSETTRIKDFRIEYSDNNSTWTSVTTGTKADAATEETFDVVSAGAHRYWRLFAINNRGSIDFIEVTEFNLLGFILP